MVGEHTTRHHRRDHLYDCQHECRRRLRSYFVGEPEGSHGLF